jgi:hypothetical protein
MKIKYFLFTLLISFVLISCHNNKRNDRVEYIYLEPQDNIKTLLDSFLVENKKNDSIYELYIQRKTPWEYDKFEPTITEITIYGGRYPFGSEKRKKEPKMAVRVDNVTFFIYSGIENYFSTNYKYAEDYMKGEPYGNVWYIRDSANVYTYFIKTTIQAPPSSETPSDIKFIPPTVED